MRHVAIDQAGEEGCALTDAREQGRHRLVERLQPVVVGLVLGGAERGRAQVERRAVKRRAGRAVARALHLSATISLAS